MITYYTVLGVRFYNCLPQYPILIMKAPILHTESVLLLMVFPSQGTEPEPVQDVTVTSKRQRVSRKQAEAVPEPAEKPGQGETKEEQEEVPEVAGHLSDPSDDDVRVCVRPKAAAQEKGFRLTRASRAKEPRLRSKRLRLAKGRAKRKATQPPEMV